MGIRSIVATVRAQISRRVDRLVPGDGSGTCGLPRLGVLARWNDSMSIASGNRVVAFSRGRVTELLLSATLTAWWRHPDHPGIKPD